MHSDPILQGPKSVSHEMCSLEGLTFTLQSLFYSAVRGVTVKIQNRKMSQQIDMDDGHLDIAQDRKYTVCVSAAACVLKS